MWRKLALLLGLGVLASGCPPSQEELEDSCLYCEYVEQEDWEAWRDFYHDYMGDSICTTSPKELCCFEREDCTAEGTDLDEVEDDYITSESSGVAIIANTLIDLGYDPEIQDGSWQVLISNNVLEPDIRFRRYVNSGYSYFEFNTPEDQGIGYYSDLPFYAEINPTMRSRIEEIVEELLED